MDIGNISMYSTDLCEDITISEYFNKILVELWRDADCFSGKRPLGNSGWQWDIYSALIKNKISSGKLDNDGFIEEFDIDECDNIIIEWLKNRNTN